MPDYHNRRPAARIGYAGRQSEKRLAKKLAGKLTPASGAAGVKGDFELGAYLVEAKSTTQSSMALKHAWAVKIAHEARMVGKEPVLVISFVTDTGAAEPDGDWCMIPMRVFRELVPFGEG